jgi:outer membrane protein TolC
MLNKVFFFLILPFILFMLYAVPAAFAESIEDACKTALSVDYRLQASRMNIESMKQSLEAAKSARYPSLNVESGYTILNEAPAAIVSIPNIPATQMTMSEDKSFSFKTTMTLPIFTGGRIAQGIEAARSGLQGSVQDEVKTALDIKMSVTEAYAGVLRAVRWVEVAESNVASLGAYVKDVANFYEQGMITKNELLASKVSLADASQRLIQARNNLEIAHAAYNRSLGRPLDQEVKIDDISAGPVQINLEALTAQALAKRPELASFAEQEKSIKSQAASVRSSACPQIALSSGYGYQQNKYQVYEDLWSATLGLKWEIFDGGIAKHNANALLRKAEAIGKLRDDTASVITLQVRKASLEVEETIKRIDVAKEAITQADENLRVTKDRYREGVGTNTEVLDAETLRVRSYTNYYNAVYDAVIAKFRLKYAVGDL